MTLVTGPLLPRPPLVLCLRDGSNDFVLLFGIEFWKHGQGQNFLCRLLGVREVTGPIIGQRAFAIAPGDSLELIRKRGLKLEWQLYPECIQLFAEGRLKTVKKSFTLKNGQKLQRTIVEILSK